jgi:hypothetical protein
MNVYFILNGVKEDSFKSVSYLDYLKIINMEFRKTLTDKRLEELSDKVRRGTPISMSEAMEVVEYQEMLKKNKLPFTDRILKFFKIK